MDAETPITYIGKVDHRNKMTKFGIKPKDRTKHMYIIGKTGTGKSTFLENMIVQDIQNGHGLAFIDPHGGSAEKLLDYIPEWRADDVIYFNPSDMEYPVAFNPLEDPGPEKRHLVTDGLMSVFKKIWPDAFSGRMEYILNMTMMALMEYPDSTVLSINRMLTDKDFRKRVIASVTDSAVRNAWDELMKWDDKRWSEAIGALVNKVGQFSTNPVIRNIIGQPRSTFDFRRAMDERKIIIVNLSKGMIGEQNAPLLGAMLITKIYLSAMSRAELPSHVLEKTPPFYFFVDEFQNFANESFASILSEARKYKLCLTVANQFIAQMEETIRDAVFGNMGTTAAFRVGPLDAEFMERVFAPVFTQEDLQNIAFGQYYLTLQIDGMGSKPFSAQGLPPIPPLQDSMRSRVIERSRANFARPRLEVEESVREFFGYARKDGAKTIMSGDIQVPRPPHLSSGGAHEGRGGSGDVPRTPHAKVGTYKSPETPKPRQIVAPSVTRKPSEPSARTAEKPQTFQKPSRRDGPAAKKPGIPPISGFKKPSHDDSEGSGLSGSLQDLLGKLDDLAVVQKTDRAGGNSRVWNPPKASAVPVSSLPPSPSRVTVAPVAEKPGEKTDEKSDEKTDTSPFPKRDAGKVLSRAATPEKKSALQEALARAMQAASSRPGGTEKQPDRESPKEAPSLVQRNEEASVAVKQPESVGAERSPEEKERQGDEIRPAHAPTPVQAKMSSTIREVPEDILRSVLE